LNENAFVIQSHGFSSLPKKVVSLYSPGDKLSLGNFIVIKFKSAGLKLTPMKVELSVVTLCPFALSIPTPNSSDWL
jgi:hypothetical protein